ncbi:MAG: hypothetical protein RIR47_1023 [Bacteroidota bacterium]
MAATRFKFVSPRVFVNEIDQSQLPASPFGVGPTVIGRFQKGPAMRPVRISSLAELTDVFGQPVAGRRGGDVWRDGNTLGPTYAAYAAQAWLANNQSINIVRILGTQHANVSNGQQGSAGWKTDNTDAATSGGAYGLFLAPSGAAATTVNGTLAAIWYLNEGSMALSGTRAGSSNTVSGSNVLLKSQGESAEFKAIVYNAAGAGTSITFNMNKDSAKYIRKVFNTNPVLTNTAITRTANAKSYWLGESFIRSYEELVDSISSSAGEVYGFIAPLASGSNYGSVHRRPMAAAKTGYVISQDLTSDTGSYRAANQTKLFRISALDSGEWESKNLKIAIEDIKGPRNEYESYGSFSVVIRSAADSDASPAVIESFGNLNLDPTSTNYIGKRIGTKYLAWDDVEKRYSEYGDYANQSQYVYVEIEQEVEQGYTDPLLLPFGFEGPPRFKGFTASSGSTVASLGNTFVNRSALRATSVTPFLDVGTLDFTGSFKFPTVALRVSASDAGLSRPTRAYFGLDVAKYGSRALVDRSYQDVLRPPPSMYDNYVASDANREISFYFTLDDLVDTSTGAYWLSGSRAAGTSITAVSASVTGSTGGYASVLAAGYDKFLMPLYGGNDGLDITEAEPFGNHLIAGTELNNHQLYTLRRAVDTIADPERVVTDIITIPGVTNENVVDHVLATCEARGDALGIIDLPNVYIPETESTDSPADRSSTTVTQTVLDFKTRAINNSYGATYYPWVQIRDTYNLQNVWVPPSVIALGALSYGQATSELWFAPAGFTRGGLSSGNAGLPVLGVSRRLSSSERDSLYDANINPIAQFPAEGIVIFGQKTLQVTASALDRINVRRLMIFLKREISVIASRLLFDQNVSVTWGRFIAEVDPLLASVKGRLGLTDYRIVLDETTTTPDLIDRNVLYAKIFLKPARAIEYIVIDFNITRTGASFAD